VQLLVDNRSDSTKMHGTTIRFITHYYYYYYYFTFRLKELVKNYVDSSDTKNTEMKMSEARIRY